MVAASFQNEAEDSVNLRSLIVDSSRSCKTASSLLTEREPGGRIEVQLQEQSTQDDSDLVRRSGWC